MRVHPQAKGQLKSARNVAAERDPAGNQLANRPEPDDWVKVVTRSGSWQVRRSFCQPSFLKRLEEPSQLQVPPAEPLRNDHRVRSTYLVRVTLPEFADTPLVIKRYVHRGLFRSLKDLFRPSGARRALEIAQQLEKHRIPTARPIAAGQVRWYGLPGQSYFVTDEVTPALSLRQVRRRNSPPFSGRVVIGALGELMARLHNAHLSHSDPTLSNFLIRTDSFALVVIDVDGLRPLLSTSAALDDFRRLFRRIPVSNRELHWFIVRYCRERLHGPTPRELRASLLPKVKTVPPERDRMPSQTPTSQPALRKKETVLRTIQKGSFRWQTRVETIDDRLADILKNPDRYLANEAEQYKSSRVVTVARIPATASDPGLVLRRLNYGKLKHRFRDFFRPSRAARAMHNALLLEQNGVATARALAVAEVRRCRWPIAAYLLTEEIPQAQTLVTYLRSQPELPRILVVRLAAMLARLHDSGFSHRDLKLTNILLDGCLQPWLIDLDGIRFLHQVSPERATADLTRFARGLVGFPAAWAQNGRFLVHYCRFRGIPNQARLFGASIQTAVAAPGRVHE